MRAGLALSFAGVLMAGVVAPAHADSISIGSGGGTGGDGTTTSGFRWVVARTDSAGTAWEKFSGQKSITMSKPHSYGNRYIDPNPSPNTRGRSGYTPYSINLYFRNIISSNGGMTVVKNVKGKDGKITQKTERITNAHNFKQYCANSDYIFWIGGGGTTRWTYNYRSTQGSFPKLSGSGPYKKTSDAWGVDNLDGKGTLSHDSKTEVDARNRYLALQKGSKPTIICTGNGKTPPSEAPPSEERPPDDSSIHDGDKVVNVKPQDADWSAPHTYRAEIKRHPITGGSGAADPIGADNLHDQHRDRITPWGEFVNADPLQHFDHGWRRDSLVAQASTLPPPPIEETEKKKGVTINLDAANQAGMAEGGILDVYKRVKMGHVKVWEDTRFICTSSNEDGSCASGYTEFQFHHKTWADPGFDFESMWQMLSVHCNIDGFNEHVATVPNVEIVSANSKRELSAAANTEEHDRVVFQFGAPGSETSKLGFYDKECPYECKPVVSAAAKDSGKKTGAVSGGEGAKNDKDGGMPKAPTGGDLNDNKFNYFRDNDYKDFWVDLWKPEAKGPVGNADKILSTTVTLSPEGTPGIFPSGAGSHSTGKDSEDEKDADAIVSGRGGLMGSASGGQTTIATKEGEEIFSVNASAQGGQAPVQKNCFDGLASNEGCGANPERWNGEYSAQLDGVVSAFKVKSTWSSNEKRPVAMNIKYEWAPPVNMVFNAIGIGWDEDLEGKRTLGSTVTKAAKVEGKCVAEFGNKATKVIDGMAGTKDLFIESTGTDSNNRMDDDILGENYSNEANFRDEFTEDDAGIKTTLLARFVRATTE